MLRASAPSAPPAPTKAKRRHPSSGSLNQTWLWTGSKGIDYEGSYAFNGWFYGDDDPFFSTAAIQAEEVPERRRLPHAVHHPGHPRQQLDRHLASAERPAGSESLHR